MKRRKLALVVGGIVIIILLVLGYLIFGERVDNPPVVSISASNYSIAEDETVEFTSTVKDEDMSTVEYLWDFGDGITSIGKDVSHTFSEPGTFTVTLKVTDKEGQNTIVSVDVEVEDIITRDASEMIITESDVKSTLGSGWNYAGKILVTGKEENELSVYNSDFESPEEVLNAEGSLEGGLSLDVVITVFKSKEDAKGNFEFHKAICEDNKDCAVADQLNVGEEGLVSIWLENIKELIKKETVEPEEMKDIPGVNYMFRKKNVVVMMNYGHYARGSGEIDFEYIIENNVFADVGSETDRFRLAQLQASRISD